MIEPSVPGAALNHVVDQIALHAPPLCGYDLVPYHLSLRRFVEALTGPEAGNVLSAQEMLPWPEGWLDPFPERPPAGYRVCGSGPTQGLQRYGKGNSPLSPDASSWFLRQREWNEGREARKALADAAFSKNSPRWKALLAAHTQMTQAIMSGLLRLYWFADHDKTPLKKGLLSDPTLAREALRYGGLTVGQSRKALFIDAGDLAKLLAPSETSPAPSDLDGVHLSPFLALMLKVAKEAEISPCNQPTVAFLEALLEQHAGTFGLSLPGGSQGTPHRRVKAMAQLLREPPEVNRGHPA